MAPQPLEAEELVKRAMTALKAKNASQFAVALGLTGRNEERRVRSWVDGKAKPNYEGTLLLLDAAGLLRETPTRKPRETTAGTELAELVAELVDLSGRLVAALERPEPRSTRPRGAGSPRRPTKRR